MRRQIILYYMILVVIGVSVAGFFISTLSHRIYMSEVEDKITSSAFLIRYELQKDFSTKTPVDFDKLAKTYSNLLSNTELFTGIYHDVKSRITFIDFSGKVLGESETSPASMENHADRNEIKEAIQGKIGRDIRKSKTLEINFLYIAVPLEVSNAPLPSSKFSVVHAASFQGTFSEKVFEKSALSQKNVMPLPSSKFSVVHAASFQGAFSEKVFEKSALSQKNVIIRVAVPLLMLQQIDKIILIYTLLGMLAGLALTAILAWKFSSSLLKPVNQLINLSHEIAEGNYSRRVDFSRNDELGKLSDNFNHMAEKLEVTIANLKDKNIKFDSIINSMTNGVIAVTPEMKIILINNIACDMFEVNGDIETLGMNILEVIRNTQVNNLLIETIKTSEPKMVEITSSLANDKVFRVYTNPIFSRDASEINSGGIISIHDITSIRKLEMIRTEFVSNVTHELKTPLTSIRGFVETLRVGAISDPEVAERFLEIIDIEAERLYMLINDILQLSEIESGHKDINISTCHLDAIISEVVSILEGVADKKNVSLQCEVQKNLLIIANKDRIKQMLINLIDNAIKYNISGGKVIIKAWKAQGMVIIKIKDTGIGIPEEHHSRVFERFYRVDKGRSRNMGGTGLGLSIVKHIVNLYNGTINLASTPGQGTEFTIQIPFTTRDIKQGDNQTRGQVPCLMS